MYAQGYVLRWDLELRQYRNWYFNNHGRQPNKQELDQHFSTIAHLTDWVPDPDFGKPMTLTAEQIEDIRKSLRSMPGLLRQFERFLAKHSEVADG